MAQKTPRGVPSPKKTLFYLTSLEGPLLTPFGIDLSELHQEINHDPGGARFEEFLFWFLRKQQFVDVRFHSSRNELLRASLGIKRFGDEFNLILDSNHPCIGPKGALFGARTEEAKRALISAIERRALYLPLPLPRDLDTPREVELWAWPGYNRFAFVPITEKLFGPLVEKRKYFWGSFLSTGKRRLAFRMGEFVVVVMINRYWGLGDSWKGELDKKELYSSDPDGLLPDVKEIEGILDNRINSPNVSESGICLAIPDPRLPARLRLV